MDNKNDDSAGSDSLDKSLQRKCVVDDMGQGEGNAAGSAAAMTQPTQGCSEVGENKKKSDAELEERTANSTKKQKTEKSVGDGLAAGGGAGSVSGETDSAIKTKAQTLQEGSAAAAGLMDSVAEASRTASDSSSASTASNTTNSTNAFESKVKQISKNLKETTLAESAHKKASLEDTSSTSSTASSASSTSSTPESEQTAGVSCAASISSSQLAAGETAADGNQMASGEPIDEHDHRSKKVRFHPDVKENDGGNRVIPKKKKKLKASHAGGSGSGGGAADETGGAQRAGEEEMELDEEEEVEEEEEFDLAKTIAEAQDYLKAHPLTFVRPYDKKSGRLQNGLLEEEDLPQLSESSEDEDIYEHVAPENGVERILGKQIKCGKVEFLLRYTDKPGLCWESEEFICKHCPTLLSKYEENREKRQDRLMRHVARRQNIRQRYTDF